MKKRILSLALTLCMLLGLLSNMALASDSGEIKVGEYVQMGTYYDEPILWRCVDIDDNGPLMMADRILCLKSYDAKGTATNGSHARGSDDRKNFGSNYWADSTIRAWLNSDAAAGSVTWPCGNAPTTENVFKGANAYDNEAGFLHGFSEKEKGAIKEVTQKTLIVQADYDVLAADKRSGTEEIKHNWNIDDVLQNYGTAYSEKVTDKVFLPDIKQIYSIYENRNILGTAAWQEYYVGIPTKKALEHNEYVDGNLNENFCYGSWLRGPLTIGDATADGIQSDGHIGGGRAWLILGVRPAFYLDTSVISSFSGSGTKEDPYGFHETTPAITIDFANETLKNFEAGATYTIDGTAVNPSDGTLDVTGYIGEETQTISIIKKGSGATKDSEAQPLDIPARPAAPKVTVVGETVTGKNDGKITGLTAGTAYQLSADNGQSWADATVTEGTILNLAPGSYQVRAKATGSSFAGLATSTMTINAGGPRTYTLEVAAPDFETVTVGYNQPEAKAITIRSLGNSDAMISSVTVNGTDFTIGGSGNTVTAGSSIKTWTIQPAAGLNAGIYTATITVTYDGNETATGQVSFAVRESKPTIRIDYENGTLTGFVDGGTYTIDGKEVTPVNGSLPIKDYFGKTVSIVKKGAKTEANSEAQSLTIPEQPAAPAGITAVGETAAGRNDGKIIGLTEGTTYQLSTDGKNWTDATVVEGAITGLAPGSYQVRIKANPSAFAGKPITVTVPAKTQCAVVFDSQEGSSVENQTVAVGGKATQPTNPTRRGFTFGGWYTEQGCIHRWDFDNVVTSDLFLYAKWVDKTYSISGKVKMGDPASAVSGAEVKLMQGNRQIGATVTTGPDGTYTFSNVAPGSYNVVAVKDNETMTILVTIENDHATHKDLTMPSGSGTVNSVLKVEGEDTPEVVVGDLDKEAEAVKTAESSASSVTITMTVESKNKDTAANAGDIITAASGKTLDFLEIKVEKKIGENTPAIISTTSNVLTIVIPFDFTGKTDVNIYRYHKDNGGSGQVDTLTTTDSNEEYIELGTDSITLHVKNFSTYAIGYTEATPTYAITVQTDGHGTASASLASAAQGTEITLSANPNSGYQFKEWQVVSGSVTIDNNKFTMPSWNVAVKAVFEYIGGSSGDNSGSGSSGTTYYTLTASAGEGGKIDPSGRVSVRRNSDKTFTITPNEGYIVDDVLVDGESVGAVSKYTFEKVTKAHTIEASFQKADAVADCSKGTTCPAHRFTDLDLNRWYHDGIHFCVEQGLMVGTTETTFAPEMPTSRAMIATILWRLQGSPSVNYALQYDDVAEETWYTEAVRWATSEEIVAGYGNGKFGPDDPITREQLATMLYRHEQKYGSGGFTGMWMFLLDFADADQVSDWADEAMHWMTMNKVVTGKGDKILDPKGQATRAEAAAMLFRFLNIQGQ